MLAKPGGIPTRTDDCKTYVTSVERTLQVIDEIDPEGNAVDIAIDVPVAEFPPENVIDPTGSGQRVITSIADEYRHYY